MNHYLLLLRKETIDFGSYSPEETQELLSDFDAWNESMIEKGRLIVSAGLGGKGRITRATVVKDGPYSETKESVTGMVIVSAADDREADEIASRCPFISRGGSVEVRPVSQLEFEDAAIPIVEAHSEKRKTAGGSG